MYKVVLVNFNFTYDQLSRDTALHYAELLGFESNVYDSDDNLIATFSPIRGWEFV